MQQAVREEGVGIGGRPDQRTHQELVERDVDLHRRETDQGRGEATGLVMTISFSTRLCLPDRWRYSTVFAQALLGRTRL